MAEAEQAGIGAFLSNISTGMQEQQLSKQRKHKLWVACIMEGGDPEACSQIVGYDPGEEGRAGAQGIMAQRKAAERGARMEEESKAALPMKAETAGELGMPMTELMKGATLPMKPEGDVTVFPRREDVEESRKVAETLKPETEETGWWNYLTEEEKGQYARGKLRTGGAGRALTDREVVRLIYEKPEEKWDEFEKNMVKRYFKEVSGSQPVTADFILKEASKASAFGKKLYQKPENVDVMVKMWSRHNEQLGADPIEIHNAYVSLGLPTLTDRPTFKSTHLKGLKSNKEKIKKLEEIGYSEEVIDFILSNYERW